MDSQPAPRFITLLSLAWPIVIARSAQVVVGFTDALMVAKLGEDALAAVTTGSFNCFFLFLLPMGSVFIVSSFSSQLSGQRKFRAARRYGVYGLVIALFGGLVSAAGIPFLDVALGAIDYEGDVRELMIAYMSVRLVAGFFVVGLEALGNYYQGLGNTILPMATQLGAMVLNVTLNWVLIFGELGAPALGVEGAAYASVISTGLAFSVLLACYLLNIGAPVPDDDEAEGALSVKEFVKTVRFGLPAGLNWFFEFAAFSFFLNFVVTGLGTTGLAALNTVFQITSMAFMPSFGIGSAGAILTGQAIGRGRLDHVAQTVKLTLMGTVGWQAMAAVVYLAIPDVLMRMFAEDPESAGANFVDIGVTMLRLSVLWQLSAAVEATMAESLRAAGDTAWPLLCRLIIAWLVFAPMSFVVVKIFDGGHVGAILSLVAYLTLLAMAFSYRYLSGRWKDIKLTDEELI